MAHKKTNAHHVMVGRCMLKRYACLAMAIMFGSLLLGIAGYHYAEDMDWIDSLLNASMILGGMGPVGDMHQTAGKLFASFYALYSCFVVLGVISILMTPAMHRALRIYHSDPESDADGDGIPDKLQKEKLI